MKKLSYLLGLLLIGGLIFSSCSKDDDDDEPTSVAPSMNFKGGTHTPSGTPYVDGDITLTTGDIFWVGINASANSNTDKKLQNLKVVRKYMEVIEITQVDSSFNESVYAADLGFYAYPQAGTELWTFTVTDKDGEKAVLSFTITTEAAAPTIAEYDETVLGSYDSQTNSSFASINGTSYSMSEAANNSDKIDWIYFDGASYGHTLAAPNDNVVEQVYPAVGNWATRNATKFKATELTGTEYDVITTATQIALVAQGADLTRLSEDELTNGMSVGDVFGFVTADAKMGLIKITEITQGSTNGLSEISFNVKVQL